MLTVGQAKKKGVVFVDGDVIKRHNECKLGAGDASRINLYNMVSHCQVTSFADRNHTGNETPCYGDLPVVVTLRGGMRKKGLADEYVWASSSSCPIFSWKPNLESLEKLANEKQYRKRCDEVLLSRGHEKEEKPMTEKQYTYELVRNLSTDEIAKSMIDGEVFYSFNGKDKYHWENGMFVNKDGDYVSTRRSLYRKKEIETITRTITYPKPVSEPLSDGDICVVVTTIGAFEIEWKGNSLNMTALKQGRIHLTKENAQAHWDALFGVY